LGESEWTRPPRRAMFPAACTSPSTSGTDRFYTAIESRPRQTPSGMPGPIQMRSMLIVFAGLPGTGKSSVARELAGKLDAVWLRIDSIEQAIRDSAVLPGSIDDAGYRAAFAVAGDNLRLGRAIVTDSVNDWMVTRDAWRDLGARAGARVVEVEVICSDPQEHRRRIETRATDVPGLVVPDWAAVMGRDYQPWNREHLTIDTARSSIDDCVNQVLAAL
jgi:predicted kinase